MIAELNDSDRVSISKMDELPWVAISNPTPTLSMQSVNRILLNYVNRYAEYENCGVRYRIVRRGDLSKYGIAYDVPGLSVSSLLEADE